MTTYEIEKSIVQHKHEITYTWRDWYFGVVTEADIPGVGKITVEKKDTGWDADLCFIIVKVDSGDGLPTYYKKEFYSFSFGDVDEGTFYEVRPTTKMITEFK